MNCDAQIAVNKEDIESDCDNNDNEIPVLV